MAQAIDRSIVGPCDDGGGATDVASTAGYSSNPTPGSTTSAFNLDVETIDSADPVDSPVADDQKLVSDGDATHYSVVNGLGSEGAYVYELLSDQGGIDQLVDWIHGSLHVELEYEVLGGTTSSVPDASQKLIADARAVDAGL